MHLTSSYKYSGRHVMAAPRVSTPLWSIWMGNTCTTREDTDLIGSVTLNSTCAAVCLDESSIRRSDSVDRIQRSTVPQRNIARCARFRDLRNTQRPSSNTNSWGFRWGQSQEPEVNARWPTRRWATSRPPSGDSRAHQPDAVSRKVT